MNKKYILLIKIPVRIARHTHFVYKEIEIASKEQFDAVSIGLTLAKPTDPKLTWKMEER